MDTCCALAAGPGGVSHCRRRQLSTWAQWVAQVSDILNDGELWLVYI